MREYANGGIGGRRKPMIVSEIIKKIHSQEKLISELQESADTLRRGNGAEGGEAVKLIEKEIEKLKAELADLNNKSVDMCEVRCG
jgi:prefoldin subunit 5